MKKVFVCLLLMFLGTAMACGVEIQTQHEVVGTGQYSEYKHVDYNNKKLLVEKYTNMLHVNYVNVSEQFLMDKEVVGIQGTQQIEEVKVKVCGKNYRVAYAEGFVVHGDILNDYALAIYDIDGQIQVNTTVNGMAEAWFVYKHTRTHKELFSEKVSVAGEFVSLYYAAQLLHETKPPAANVTDWLTCP